jgi:hypothetical protein
MNSVIALRRSFMLEARWHWNHKSLGGTCEREVTCISKDRSSRWYSESLQVAGDGTTSVCGVDEWDMKSIHLGGSLRKFMSALDSLPDIVFMGFVIGNTLGLVRLMVYVLWHFARALTFASLSSPPPLNSDRLCR